MFTNTFFVHSVIYVECQWARNSNNISYNNSLIGGLNLSHVRSQWKIPIFEGSVVPRIT
jgi:hypothetical protein